MSQDKLRIGWICHFSNSEIRNELPLLDNNKYQEYAPWIWNTINCISKDDKLDLHIIAPHVGLKKLIFDCRYKNVVYHFWKSDIPLIQKRLWKIPVLLRYPFCDPFIINKLLVRLIVSRINPDIINLQGAENDYYSSTIMQFRKKYPVLITIQGFISHSILADNPIYRSKIETELKILMTFRHFGIRTKTMGNDIMIYNSNAVLHWQRYFIPIIHSSEELKEYDIVFFARFCKDKGIEDLLQAILIVKKKIPEVSLCVIGSGSQDYISQLKSLALSLDIDKNINWVGFLTFQKDVHAMVSKAKISVLPTYHDIIPGTIIESMQLGLPVVSYRVGSIPELNDVQENVLLVEKGDIQGLAREIIRLLTDESFAKEMSRRGNECMRRKYSNIDILGEHLSCYREVIADYQKHSKSI